MCFIKSAPEPIAQEVQDPIATRKQADASVTKNSASNQTSSRTEAIKTSPIGLTMEAVTEKKTLLGE